MCGILAVLGKVSPELLSKIIVSSSYLSRRGPDSSSTIVNDQGVFVFHRLSINDTSTDGDQPMVSDTTLLMCNGEIYNHREIQKKYSLVCHSKSDCEVILRLYEKFRSSFRMEEAFVKTVDELYGVFAIVLVDSSSPTPRILIARDRIGVRPLYFGSCEDTFAFCSIPNCLAEFCTDIKPVLPGQRVFVDRKGGLTLLNRDCVELTPISSRIVDGELRLREALINAVRLRLMSDRPMGCLLSGGLDSSLVASILVRLIGSKNVRTYSIGMKGSTDLAYARKVATFLNTEHTEVLFTPQEGIDVIPEVIQTLASYDITTIRASVGMYLLAKYIALNTSDKVIFSGEGSDEILEGYLYFHLAPTPEEGEVEALRLVKELHTYDVLRADRCISSWGLEPRVPFLDRHLVDVSLSLPASEKCPRQGVEKYILRKAFEDLESPFLPKEVLWRKKEAFSDGVSSVEKSWYSHIQDHAETVIPDYLFNPNFPSKEAMYYKMIFDNIFPTYKLQIPYWLPRWSSSKDPSARTLDIYKKNP